MTAPDSVPQEEGLPFHPATVLLSVWRRRAVVVAFGALGAVAGLIAALSFGERRYTAETMLMFRPALVGPDDTSSSVETILNLVKVPATLERVRRQLNDDLPIPALAASYEVGLVKNTDLVAIRATAETAKLAADRANALRDAFLANQADLSAEKSGRQTKLIEKQLDDVKTALSVADQKRIDIGIKTGVVDLEKQTGTYLQQAASMDIFYGQAVADRTAVDEQNASLDRAAKDLQKKVEKEQKIAGAQEDLSSLNIRSGRLRSSIEEDRRDRAAKAELERLEAEFRRASDLASQGLISKSLLDEAKAKYEAQKARALDTDQIKNWKAELAKLDAGVIPTKATDTPSSAILREVMLKRLDLDLQKTAVAERVKSLDASREQIKSQVERLPELRRQLADVGREVESLELRRRTLEDLLAKSRAAAGATSADFTVVSPALPPLFPRSSNRMMVLAAILVGFTGFGVLLVAAVELSDSTLRSAPEVTVRAGATLAGSIPKLPAELAAVPTNAESPLSMMFRRLAYGLRRTHDRPIRLLVTSARPGEGVTFVASHLAAAFGRLDERVAYVDARMGPISVTDLRALALTNDPMDGGWVLPRDVETAIVEGLKDGGRRASRLMPRGMSAERAFSPSTLRVFRRIEEGTRSVVHGIARASRAFTGLVLSILRPARPDLRTSLALAPSGAGLGSYLAYRRDSPRDVSHPTSLVGLSCIPRDGEEPGPLASAVAWARMRDLLNDLSERFPVIVIDASACLDSLDAEVLADQATHVLVVARAEETKVGDIQRTLRRLAAAKGALVGVLLNGVDRAFMGLVAEAEA